MASRTVAVRIAVEGLNASIQALKQGGAEGQAALERIGIGAQAANQNMQRLEQATTSFARVGRSNIIQQAGYQIGDFAVQVQSGTNIVTAGTQQLSQLAGAFGIVGSVVGGVLSILGATYTYFDKMGTSAGSAAEQLKKLDEGTKEYQGTLRDIAPLQEAYLENLAQAEQAQKRVTAAFVESNVAAAARSALNPDVSAPGATTDPSLVQQVSVEQMALITQQNRALIDQATSLLHNARAAEDIAIDIYDQLRKTRLFEEQGRRVSVSPGGFEAGAGSKRTLEDKSLAEAAIYDQQQLIKLQSDREAADKRNAAAAETRRKQAEALHITNEKLLDQAKLATQAAQEELDAVYMGEDARKRANVEREYELRLLAAAQPAQKDISLALIDEANRRRDLALATIEQSRALEDAQKKIDASPGGVGGHGFYGGTEAEAEASRAQLEALGKKNAKREADATEDAYTNAWKNIAENVDTITTNMFDDMLEKGEVSFKDLADSIGDTMRTTISGAIGDAVSQPLRDLASGKSNVDWSRIMQGKASGAQDYLAAAGAGAAGGYAVGSIYAQAAGKEDTYAGVGGAIGGGLGAAAGAAGAPGGPIVWGTLGAMAGSYIGGLFGSGGLGNDQSVQKFGSSVAKAIWSDKSFSEENRKVTGGIVDQLGQLSEALKATGANINDITIGLTAGNKTGISVQGKKYETPEDALVGAIKLLLANTGGLQGSQVTALQTTKGRNVQEVMQDLAFAKEFDKITFSGTAAEAAMRDLQDQFDATGRRARALGLDEVALGAARTRAMDQLTLAVQRQMRDLGAQFQMAIATTDLDRSLIGINQQFSQLKDTFTDAGYSAENLAQLETARIANETQARQQAAAQAQAEADARAQAARAEAEARAQQARAAAEQRRQDAERRKQEAIQAAQAREQDRRQRRDFFAQFLTTVTTDTLQQQVININNQFAQLRDTMGELGYSAAAYREVEKARIREVAAAYEAARRQTRDFAVQFQQSTSDSELGNALLAIDLEFAHLAESARDAGYSVRSLQDVEKARQRERAQAIEAEQRQARGISVNYLTAVTESPLEKTLLGVNESFAALTDTLKDAGYSSASLAEVEKARVRAQAEAVEQLRLQAVGLQSDLENKIRGIGSFYDDLIRPLEAVNQNSMLNPAGQIGAARTAFQRDLAGAGAQDPEAIRRLAGSAGTLQNLVQQNYGTAGIGGQYLREVQGGISGTIAGLQQERAAALADLPQIVQKTTVDIIRENRADIDRVVEQLELLRRDLRSRGIAA